MQFFLALSSSSWRPSSWGWDIPLPFENFIKINFRSNICVFNDFHAVPFWTSTFNAKAVRDECSIAIVLFYHIHYNLQNQSETSISTLGWYHTDFNISIFSVFPKSIMQIFELLHILLKFQQIFIDISMSK